MVAEGSIPPSHFYRRGRVMADPRLLTSIVGAAEWPIPAYSLLSWWPRNGRCPQSHFYHCGSGMAEAHNLTFYRWCCGRANAKFSLLPGGYLRSCTVSHIQDIWIRRHFRSNYAVTPRGNCPFVSPHHLEDDEAAPSRPVWCSPVLTSEPMSLLTDNDADGVYSEQF